jgi:hypothetical protein
MAKVYSKERAMLNLTVTSFFLILLIFKVYNWVALRPGFFSKVHQRKAYCAVRGLPGVLEDPYGSDRKQEIAVEMLSRVLETLNRAFETPSGAVQTLNRALETPGGVLETLCRRVETLSGAVETLGGAIKTPLFCSGECSKLFF